jgi:hypothetical protein
MSVVEAIAAGARHEATIQHKKRRRMPDPGVMKESAC